MYVLCTSTYYTNFLSLSFQSVADEDEDNSHVDDTLQPAAAAEEEEEEEEEDEPQRSTSAAPAAKRSKKMTSREKDKLMQNLMSELQRPQDVCGTYLEHLGSRLRQLDADTQKNAMYAMDRIMMQAELGRLPPPSFE